MMGAYAQSDFDTLYRDSYNNLLRLAYRSTKDYHESEDLVDEAFVIYLQKSEIVHINNPRAYLVKIMSNLICNYLRLKMHDNVPLSNALENELGVDGLKRSLADALPKELQLWEREILLMRFEDQLSNVILSMLDRIFCVLTSVDISESREFPDVSTNS